MFSPQLKEQRQKKNDMLSKHSGIDLTFIQNQNILNHIKTKMTLYEATQE